MIVKNSIILQVLRHSCICELYSLVTACCLESLQCKSKSTQRAQGNRISVDVCTTRKLFLIISTQVNVNLLRQLKVLIYLLIAYHSSHLSSAELKTNILNFFALTLSQLILHGAYFAQLRRSFISFFVILLLHFTVQSHN